MGKFLQYVGAGVLIFGVATFLFGRGGVIDDAARGLTIGSIEGRGDSVKYVLATDADGSGRVAVWFLQNDIIKCEHWWDADANRRYTVDKPCRALKPGSFSVQSAWQGKDTRADRAVAVGEEIKFN